MNVKSSFNSPDFEDHFSHSAKQYQQFRPEPPIKLIQKIINFVPEIDLAVDLGTGNGQVAKLIAPYFEQVIGIDASTAQLQLAEKMGHVQYVQAMVEDLPIENERADLVTGAQVLHWCDVPKVWEEVERILKPQGVVAFWNVSDRRIEEAPNVLEEFRFESLKRFWPKKIQDLHHGWYGGQRLPKSFEEVELGVISEIRQRYALDDFMRWTETWSAVLNLDKQRKRKKEQLMENFREKIEQVIGKNEPLEVVSKIDLKIGRKR